jgi:hypothetical protein
MNPRDYKIARELKRRLANAVEMIDFKVYGSKARGDDDEFSEDETENSPLRASPILRNIKEEGIRV